MLQASVHERKSVCVCMLECVHERACVCEEGKANSIT